MLPAFALGVAARAEEKSGAASARLTGDLRGDAELFFTNEVGEGGVARIFCAAGDFGEADASKRVRLDGAAGVCRSGRSARGTLGILSASL